MVIETQHPSSQPPTSHQRVDREEDDDDHEEEEDQDEDFCGGWDSGPLVLLGSLGSCLGEDIPPSLITLFSTTAHETLLHSITTITITVMGAWGLLRPPYTILPVQKKYRR